LLGQASSIGKAVACFASANCRLSAITIGTRPFLELNSGPHQPCHIEKEYDIVDVTYSRLGRKKLPSEPFTAQEASGVLANDVTPKKEGGIAKKVV
jgi:hypothetical protein